jgi:hypothetical protein
MIKPAPKMKELLSVHYGWVIDEIEMVQVSLSHVCPHLDGNGKCTLWNEDPEKDMRPEYCQEYLCEKAQTPGLLIVEAEATN